MLQFIRDHIQGVFVWIIIAIIIAAFAMVGVNSYLSDNGQSYVAKVNDVQILSRDFQVALQQERAFRERIFGENINPALLKDDVLKRAALDRLISAELITQAANDAGFRVADIQLGSQIRQMKEFQSDGQFDQQRYVRLLSNQGMSQEGFERSLRRDTLARQLIDGLTNAAVVTSNEVDQLLRLRKQQRQFSYMLLETAALTDDVKVDDASIQKYYDEHAGEYITDAQVSIDYLELSPDSIDAQFTADEQTLKKMYEEQLAEFSKSEERRASHILIKPSDESDAARQAAEDKARDLLKQLRNGADFAELARANSADPGSARQGGDLGYFGHGMMVAAFEDKAFSMNKGEISEPVQTPYGYHIIKLTDIKAGETQSFAEVRDELAERYRQEKAEEQFYELVDLMTNLTFENPTTLSVAADELGLTIKTSALFSRESGDGIASDEHVRETAFSDDVLEAGNNSEVLTLGENHVVVVRIHDRRPSAQQPLAEVRAEITERLRRQQAGEQLRQLGEGIVAKLRDGEDAPSLASKLGSEWNSSGFIDRFDNSIDRAVLQQVFRMQRPVDDASTTAGAMLANGDYVIATVYAVRDGKPAEIDAKQRQSVAEDRRRSLGQHLGAKVMASLKQRADVVEYLDKI